MQQLALRVTNVSGVHDRAHESYRRLEDMKLNARNVANNTAKSTTLRTSNKDKFYNTTVGDSYSAAGLTLTLVKLEGERSSNRLCICLG